MQALDTIKAACQQAVEEAHQHRDWQAAYCEVVTPETVLEMIAQLKAGSAKEQVSEHTALLKLIRELTGYIKFATGDKPDAVRDDMLLQARELVAQFER
jgi:excinuclease UvrABC helicase subunit UvrB